MTNMTSPTRLIVGLLCLIGPSLTAHATIYTWQGPGTPTTPTSGSWNNASYWGGTLAQSGTTTELDFGATASYNSTNNISNPFQLNILGLTGSAGTVTIAGSQLEFSANGSTLPVINQNGAANISISAPILIDSGSSLTIQQTGTTTTGAVSLSGLISGSGTLTMNDSHAANLTITGANNTYSGGTVLAAGSLITSAAGALGSGTITLGGTGKWTMNTATQSYANNINLNGAATIEGDYTTTLSGSVTLGNNTLTLRDFSGSGGVRTISGVISGSGGVTKNDATIASGSYWVLSGNNTYNGTTTVNAGVLAITGTTSGQGNYLVTNSGTTTVSGTLSGNGTIGLASNKNVTIGATSAAPAAILAPTDSTGTSTSIGTLTFNWANSSGTPSFNIGTSGAATTGELSINLGTAGSSSEIVVGSNAVKIPFNIYSGILSLTGAPDGSNYVIANYFSTTTGTFSSLILNGTTQASASSFVYGSYDYTVLYNQADSNGGFDILLSAGAVPEPSVIQLLGVGLLCFGLRCWIRHVPGWNGGRRESSVEI